MCKRERTSSPSLLYEQKYARLTWGNKKREGLKIMPALLKVVSDTLQYTENIF